MLARINAMIESRSIEHGAVNSDVPQNNLTTTRKSVKRITPSDLIDYSPADLAVDAVTLPWEMSRVERMAFQHLLGVFQPAIALEVGTEKGGSLQAIMQYADEAISIGKDVDNQTNLQKQSCFTGVEFIAGDPAQVLPEMIQIINANKLNVNFIFIDGERSTESAQSNFETALRLAPKQSTCLVVHHSFMPQVRRALLNVDWPANPHVHYVEIDYVQGAYLPAEYGACKMIGGLAVILLKPEIREERLDVFRSHDHAFNMLMPFAANK